MIIKCFPVGHLETNCYLVTDEETMLAAAVDPGDESNVMLDYLEENRITLREIFLTHGHYDHTGAAETLREETGARIWIHPADLAEGPGESFRFYSPLGGVGTYAEGDEIPVGGLTFRVLETPGHSPGSVSLVCGPALFCGDTLFRDGAGRTDLPGGDMEQEMASLKKLALLPGNPEVYPGHMDDTTLDRERSVNRWLRRACGIR